jgi:hypothetical protein
LFHKNGQIFVINEDIQFEKFVEDLTEMDFDRQGAYCAGAGEVTLYAFNGEDLLEIEEVMPMVSEEKPKNDSFDYFVVYVLGQRKLQEDLSEKYAEMFRGKGYTVNTK